MALTADEVPVAIVTGTAPLLRGCANVPPGVVLPVGYTPLVSGGMLPYGTHALLPPGAEAGMDQPDAMGPKFSLTLDPNGPSGYNPVIPPPS